jgi:hypothetical protein
MFYQRNKICSKGFKKGLATYNKGIVVNEAIIMKTKFNTGAAKTAKVMDINMRKNKRFPSPIAFLLAA